MIFIYWNQSDILAKTVNNDPDFIVVTLQSNTDFHASEHTEDDLGVLCHIEAFEGFLSLTNSIDNVQIFHFIHTIMLDPVRRNIIRIQLFDDVLHCQRMLVICCPIDRMIRI